jgi:hypothetical protein
MLWQRRLQQQLQVRQRMASIRKLIASLPLELGTAITVTFMVTLTPMQDPPAK